MNRTRLYVYSMLICLPSALLTVAGLVLALTWTPRLVRNEPRRITMLYREVAEDLKAHADAVAPVRERPAGPANGKIDGMPWGYAVENGRARVWIQSLSADGKKEWRVRSCDPYEAIPYGWLVYGGGGLVALVLIGLTAFAVWSFRRFLKEREDFLAATAHDLTTPLTGLRLWIGRDDAEAKNLNERMIRLVGNLKDFLRLGGRPKPKSETFDLVTAYREAYSLFAADYRDLFDGEDVAVEGGAEPVLVQADETMTVQILWNLLGNDLKYAAPYGRVAVRFLREGKCVSCAFVDEGQGMTPKQMRKAFDRYYRAKTVLTSGKGGFGIGLCTAKEFVRAMGGDLTVAANRPKGCIFTLTLPAVPAAPAAQANS